MIDTGKHSRGNPFRKARIGRLRKLVDHVIATKGDCNILDVGGTYMFWRTWHDLSSLPNVRITCVNKEFRSDVKASEADHVQMINGDARNLSQFSDHSFDIAFSNSVIEHVGMWVDMQSMAGEIRRIANYYMVQTPYFWFPVEPHARTLFIHWLPESLKYRIVMHRKCGYWDRQHNVGDAVRKVQAAYLLDIRQFMFLFPDAILVKERAFGLVKSLIAIRGPG